jgi:hypothetical protein
MKILICLLFFVSSFNAKAQSEISFKTLQDLSSASSIDDIESTLRNLKYSFRETVTNPDGASHVVYEKINSNMNAYDLIVLFKNKSNIGFSNVRFMTYYEPQFYRLKTECTQINKLQQVPEEISNGCLVRKYSTDRYNFQFKNCNNQSNGIRHYQIEVLFSK